MKTKEHIEKLLKKNTQGSTIAELAGKSGISRQTISKFIANLEGAEKIEIRNVGNAKLVYWKDKKEGGTE